MTTRDEAKLKATQLLRLACSSHSQEEARTAALSAIHIINKYGLSIEAPAQNSVSAQGSYVEKPIIRSIQVKYASVCVACLGSIHAGERALWEKGYGLTCWECYQYERWCNQQQ